MRNIIQKSLIIEQQHKVKGNHSREEYFHKIFVSIFSLYMQHLYSEFFCKQSDKISIEMDRF